MRILKQILLILLIIGFVEIQFASLLDDPQHLIEPNPDCFICLVSQTSGYINHHTTIALYPDIIIYLAEKSFLEPYSHQYFANFSSRAPPFLTPQ
jgi:hypothetical protein